MTALRDELTGMLQALKQDGKRLAAYGAAAKGSTLLNYMHIDRRLLDFVVDRSTADGSGLTHDTRRALSGESWQQGQVLLSWDDVLGGAADPADGHNVVIHEFAHQLDQERGRANGAPWLGRREAYARWAAVMGAEFHALQQRLARGETGVIDAYGATDPAEFFAVISEHFFEQAALLAAAHPALFGELVLCYRTDPLNW